MSWEARWRRLLGLHADTAAIPTLGFVKASPRKFKRKAKPSDQCAWPPQARPADGNVVLVLTRLGSGVSVRADWPLHAVQGSAAWLREVLA